MFQLVQAVADVHAAGFVHRDIKPHNILVRASMRDLVLADFGACVRARMIPEQTDREQQTTWYRAPELLAMATPTPYTFPVDMWSVGCVMLFLLYGKHAFAAPSEDEVLARIFCLCGTPHPSVLPGSDGRHRDDRRWAIRIGRSVEGLDPVRGTPAAADLLRQLLTLDPTRRITAAAALRHPWIQAAAARPDFASRNTAFRSCTTLATTVAAASPAAGAAAGQR